VLEVSHLAKAYSTPSGPLTVLADVSLSLKAGEAAAIMGPSGSGKSSLLYALGALEAPSSGTVMLDGCNPFVLPAAALADFRNVQIGFVFQDHCLLPQCSVLENVLVPTLVARADLGNARDDQDYARKLVEQVGLAGRIGHRPSQLSGGERQRVALARALIRRPRLVLCDEPTGNLDAASASTVTGMLLDLHRQHQNILVVVTHSAAVAERLPIRFDLSGGRLVDRTRELVDRATAARSGPEGSSRP
jgi:lipoprotein-releasing system ATP-binding protein